MNHWGRRWWILRRQTFKLEGYEQQIKTAGKKSETASVIWLPASWTGKKVAVILLEE
jgi:hypothetical protein